MAKKFYEVLGVSENATTEEIRKAYKQQALKNHPDRVSPDRKEEADAKFKEINQAHETLSNEATRKAYDKGLINDDGQRVHYQQPPDQQASESKKAPKAPAAEEDVSAKENNDSARKFREKMKALFNDKLSQEEREKLCSQLSTEERTEFNNLLNELISRGEKRLDFLEGDIHFLNFTQERFIAFQKQTGSDDSSQLASSPPSTFIEWIGFIIDSFFDKKEMPQPLISKENREAWGDDVKDMIGEFKDSKSEQINDQKTTLDRYKAMRNDLSVPMQPMKDTSSNPINDIKNTHYQFDKGKKQSKDDSPDKSPSQHNKI